MVGYNLIVFLLISSNTYSVYVALKGENVMGGFYASQENFRYHTIIYGIHNSSSVYAVIGSGAIIHEHFVLTAAQCFFNSSNLMKPLSFSVGVGTIILQESSVTRVNIENIYTLSYNPSNKTINDIAVAKLSVPLDLNEPNLCLLKLCTYTKSLRSRSAIVSGFGYNWIEVAVNIIKEDVTNIDDIALYKLKYLTTRILNNKECEEYYPNSISKIQLCSHMVMEAEGLGFGTCSLDVGSPLVINDTLVGIASRSSVYVGKHIQIALYTKVAAYHEYIKSVISGTVRMGYVYKNLPNVFELNYQ